MARPSDLPPAEAYAHGARARYVAGCRCAPCRAANTAAYHARQARAKALAAELPPPAPAPAPQEWTARDGTTRVRIYKRACPGVPGRPCPTGSHLRKDSKGGVCGGCRERLVWNGLVPAAAARAHLRRLSRAGVGRRAVGAACDVADTTLQEVIAGRKLTIRASTERAILAVDKGAISDGALVDAKPTWRILDGLLHRDEGFTKTELARRLGYGKAIQLGRGKITAANAMRVAKFHRALTAEAED